MGRIIAGLVLCFLTGSAAFAATESLTLYSDTCWHAEAGDLLGSRMGIIRLFDATYAFFQNASGDWEPPSIGQVSSDELKRGKLAFTISDKGKAINFRGTITEKVITGQFDGWRGDDGKPLVVHLRRAPAVKKRVPDCR